MINYVSHNSKDVQRVLVLKMETRDAGEMRFYASLEAAGYRREDLSTDTSSILSLTFSLGIT